ncbi:MAG: Mut7-C RNAse domain-containing protein, partial [Candidatus Anstonellales archaeon]
IMLSNICRWLRILGIDSEMPKEQDDDFIITYAYKTKRILLTKDKELYNKALLHDVNSYLIVGNDKLKIINNLIKDFNLKISFPRRTRCTVCNGKLITLKKNELANDKLLPQELVNKNIKNMKVYKCTNCNKYYWEGMHWKNILKFVKNLNLNSD